MRPPERAKTLAAGSSRAGCAAGSGRAPSPILDLPRALRPLGDLLRALANDLAHALREPLEALGVPWTAEVRTGDTLIYGTQEAAGNARLKRRRHHARERLRTP